METHLDIGTITSTVAVHRARSIDGEGLRRAAVALVLRSGADGGVELLYIQRGEHPDDPWSGHMAFPGGHVDPEDAGAEAAAVREAFEEVGLRLDVDGRRVGRLDDLQAMSRGRFLSLVITPVVFVLERDVPLAPAADEVADTVWVPLARLTDGSAVSTLVYRTGGSELTLPCWRIAPYCIWGLTYLMTRNFLEVVGSVDLPGDPRLEGAPVHPGRRP